MIQVTLSEWRKCPNTVTYAFMSSNLISWHVSCEPGRTVTLCMSLSRGWPACSLACSRNSSAHWAPHQVACEFKLPFVRISVEEFQVRTCHSTVYVRCGQDNDSVELIEVLCSCAHTGHSRLVSFQVLYDSVWGRPRNWVGTRRFCTIRRERSLSQFHDSETFLSSWMVLSVWFWQGKNLLRWERGTGKRALPKKEVSLRIRSSTTLSSSQQTWETNTPSPTAASNSQRSSSECSS